MLKILTLKIPKFEILKFGIINFEFWSSEFFNSEFLNLDLNFEIPDLEFLHFRIHNIGIPAFGILIQIVKF